MVFRLIFFAHFDLDSSSYFLFHEISQVVEDNILSHGLMLYRMCSLYKGLTNHELSVLVDYSCSILSILYLLY
jgi:hypothetical protein